MILYMSQRIALFIKKRDPSANLVNMTYALAITIHLLLCMLTPLLIGYATGYGSSTLLAIVSFGFLRLATGGQHLKSLEICYVVTTLMLVIIPHISITELMIIWINITALIPVVLFAPLITEASNISQRVYPYMKAASILLICINFIINSPVIALAFLAQACFCIPYRR